MVAKSHSHKIITEQVAHPVGFPIERKRPLDAFGKDAQQLVVLKDVVGIFLAGYDSPELRHEIELEGKLDQGGVNKESRKPAGSLHNAM
jgi:hypothetical protein